MTGPRPLSLDHLTVVDTTPAMLVETAGQAGFSGVCMFLESMAVLPDMPAFSLHDDVPARKATRDALRSSGLTLDLVYPFTLAGRTIVSDLEPALEIAAWLGGSRANVLVYDADPVRRADNLCRLAELAENYAIELSLEFYPASRVRTLDEAAALLDQVQRGDIGLTLDLLHLMRSGAATEMPDPRVSIAQLCDGPATAAPDRLEWEASHERQLPGQGKFDIAGFVASLAPDCPISLEIPRQSALRAGLSPLELASQAYQATRQALDAHSKAGMTKLKDLQTNA